MNRNPHDVCAERWCDWLAADYRERLAAEVKRQDAIKAARGPALEEES